MSNEADVIFPNLYQTWRDFDLGYYSGLGPRRSWFYTNLRPDDELRLWRFIEQNYLLRYEEFMAVRSDWYSSGLWSLPFPGSNADRWNFSNLDNVEILDRDERFLENREIPERAQRLLREWHDPLDARPLEGGDHFDHEASEARGLAAAGEVKLSLGEDIYVEYRKFREIVIVEGEPKELEVPEYVLELGRGGRG